MGSQDDLSARHIKVDEAERSRASYALTVGLRQAQYIAGRPSASSKRIAQPEANTASYSRNSAQSRTTATDGTLGAPLPHRTPKIQEANWGHTPNLSLGPNTPPSPDSRSNQRHPTSGAPQSDRRWSQAREGSRHQVPLPAAASNLFESHVAYALRAYFGENARSGCRDALREARVGLPGDLRPPPPLKKRSGPSPTRDFSTAWHGK